MLSLPGGIGYDPVTRRRTRRLLARLRPWLLPVAVVVAALVVAGGTSGAEPAVLSPPAVPAAPAGLVLVAVTPADPAVLDVVVVGSRVDVYAAVRAVALDARGAQPARLLAADALVVGPGAAVPGTEAGDAWPGGAGAGGPGAGLVPAAGARAPALTLAVADAEAAAIASHPDGGLTLAVLPP